MIQVPTRWGRELMETLSSPQGITHEFESPHSLGTGINGNKLLQH